MIISDRLTSAPSSLLEPVSSVATAPVAGRLRRTPARVEADVLRVAPYAGPGQGTTMPTAQMQTTAIASGYRSAWPANYGVVGAVCRHDVTDPKFSTCLGPPSCSPPA